YFKDYPLESIHPWARAASVAGRCVYKQGADAFWKFHDWIYDKQEMITPDNLNPQIMSWAPAAGVDSIQLGRCMDQKATDADVTKNIAEARALGVDATPTVYINGRKFASAIQWNDLQSLLNFEIENQAKLAACEDTCVVNMPKVGGKN